MPAGSTVSSSTLASGGTGCVVCGLDQNANQILLCDGCDAEYHTYCLVPPHKEIPEGDFFCKRCKDAKRVASGHANASASTLSTGSTQTAAATQAGFAVQDENGRMIPVRSEDVRESKYRGVLKLLQKGAKKPFVARIHMDGKYVQLGLYNSEIEAAHAFDKIAIQFFGRSAQLNFPHLHEGFVRPSSTATSGSSASTSLGGQVRATATQQGTSASPGMASPSFGTPGRGRGRGRGRGAGRGGRGGAPVGGGGRGKRRLDDSVSPLRDDGSASVNGSAVKRRKAPTVATGGDAPIMDGPKYIGVQVFRGYAHAQIVVNHKTVNLGTFPNAMDAAIAYDKAALKYFGGEISAKDATHDGIVLNFPNKRAELLKQLIEESMHQKARQASGSQSAGNVASFSANRSMQSAKYNLSVKKLENWLLKLQRSVKLVEAAHRVQWDGVALVKPEATEAEESAQTPHDIKLELHADAGPTIRTEFTKKQQRLRSSAQQIEAAVNLMVQELKIYAEATPVDVSFHPPPRSHVLLDLMSTSRFLKLCSTINGLAHCEVKKAEGTGQDESATSDDSFEALVQAVVDYRTRLQMATSSEKIKLQSLVEADSASSTAVDAKSEVVVPSSSESTINDAAAVLQRARYVKRKVERIRKVRRTAPLVVAEEASAEEEHKECESASTEDMGMEVDEATPAVEDPTPEQAAAPAEMDTATQPTTATTDEAAESSKPDEVQSKDEGEAADREKVAEEQTCESAAPADQKATQVEESYASMEVVTEASSSVVEESPEVSAAVPPADQDSVMAPVNDSVMSETTVKEVVDNVESTELAVSVPKTEEPETEVDDVIVEEHWQYCLAIQPQSTGRTTQGGDEQPWRLIPLESDSGEFLKDVYLTDSEVAAIEVSDAEACGDGKPNLAELHQHELTLREKIKAETDRRQSLEGVIKIEQERLSQVFVVYRRMLEGIMTKSAEVQKKHQRIARDLLLVQLMKETFAPILDDLLAQCESVFLERLKKLSDRFEDFQQEFDYYTEALLSVSGDKTQQPNGHMKSEDAEIENMSSPPSPSELAVVGDGLGLGDDESTGLRGAYVSFYMEEIEGLWRERCYALESLMAILRSLQTVDATPDATGESLEPVAPSLFRRRVEESLARWKSVEWPQQLATPEFVTSFAADGSQRSLPLTSTAIVKNEREGNNESASPLGELKQIIIDLTQESPPTLPSRMLRPTTLVVYHPVFLDHQTPKDHPECPERLNRIIAILATVRKKFDDVLKIDRLSQSPEELSPSELVLLAVHSPAYLDQLKSRSVEASSTPPSTSAAASASSSLVFETNRGVVDLTPSKKKSTSTTLTSPTGSMGSAFGAASMLPTGIVMDTYVSPKSWDVARAAAGTVCLAVDRVLRKEVRNAACLVRPPGHHVGRHGRTLDAPSSGFCLLNNVIIGAVHARQYPWIRRVAVLDWDIHHGNGTEELMRDDADGFFASIHLYASGKFFPGTGKSKQQQNLVNVALENSGAGSGSAVFRSALQDQILPAMRAFRPDIIFISAGFDGHKDDILGGRAAVKNTAVPAGYLEEDYAWATQEVLKLADECCDGRVISVLEGGYDVRKETNSLAKSVAAHVSAIASYEQERQKKLSEDEKARVAEAQAVPVKQEGIGGLLRSLLAKSLDDEDVIIIDDDEDDDEFSGKGARRLSSAMDGDEEEEPLDEELDDDMDGDGVEVDEDDGIAHGDDHDALDGDDVVMTDEDHDRDHSVDGDDDVDGNSSADPSFAASLSVDDEDDASHRLGDAEDATPHNDSRAATPEFNGLDKPEQPRGEEDDGDDEMMGDNDLEDQDHHDLLGHDDDNDDHDAAEDETGLEELS